MVGPRRRAREIVLQILTQMDVSPELDARRALALYFDHLAADADPDDGDELAGAPPAPPRREPATRGLGSGTGSAAAPAPAAASYDRAMVDELVTGAFVHRAELDELLQTLSRNWRVERMALVERNVIRLGLLELKYFPSVPANVVIDEAIELTKRFGTAEGAAFVNGLLDRAVTELGLRP